MTVTPNRRAAHFIRMKAPDLAERMTADQYRRQPELSQRYGEPGRRHCLKDAEYHLHFLAASVEFGDARVFADYIVWCTALLARRGIPKEDVVQTVQALRNVIHHALPAAALPIVLSHIDEATKRQRR